MTGATQGIGLAISRLFLEEGANVALLARTRLRLDEVLNEFSKSFPHSKFLTIESDVSNVDSVRQALKLIHDQWGGLDIVVSNVGDGRSVPDPMPREEDFTKTWVNNFSTAEIIVRESLQKLEVSNGSIVFISSIAGLEAFGAPTDYSVAKSAVISLSKNLARKLAPNIRVNCVAPGNVYFEGGSWEEKMKDNPERVHQIIQSTVPMKRFGTPKEIADVVVFLSSEKASFITGSCIVVDGGQTVGIY